MDTHLYSVFRQCTAVALASLVTLLLMATESACQTAGTIFRGEGPGFYHLTASAAAVLFVPSVDVFVVADTNSDYSDYSGDFPGLRRLILMDATGNYLSEYFPPKTVFVKSDSLRLELFGDPTQSRFLVPLTDGLHLFEVVIDASTGQPRIAEKAVFGYGELEAGRVYRMLSLVFTTEVLVLHDVPNSSNLAMISKVDLVEGAKELKVVVRTIFDSNMYWSLSNISLSRRSDEQVYLCGPNNNNTAGQVLNTTDLSFKILAIRVQAMQNSGHQVSEIVQDSRRTDRTYFITDRGLYVVDLSDPTSPVTVNYFSVQIQGMSLREIPATSSVHILAVSYESPDIAGLKTLQNVQDDQSVYGDIIVPKPPVGLTFIAGRRLLLAEESSRRSSFVRSSRVLQSNSSNYTFPSGPYLVVLTVAKADLDAPLPGYLNGSDIVTIFKRSSNLFLLNSSAVPAGLAGCSLKPNKTTLGLAVAASGSISQSMVRVFSMVPLSPCLALYCHECTDNPNECSVCFEGFALYQGTCTTLNGLGPGFGVDPELNKAASSTATNSSRIWNSTAIKPCSVRQCADCKFNYKECKVCKEGWTLANGICSVELDARLQTLASQSTETQLGYILELSTSSKEQPTLTPSEYADFAQNYLSRSWLVPRFVSSKNASTGTETLSVRLRVNAVSSLVYTLTVTYNRIPQNADTLVIVCDQPSASQFNYSEGSLSLRRKNLSFPLDMQLVSSSDQIESYASFGGAVSALTLSTDNYAGSSILMALMAFDFSGHLLRFAQIIKIVNKIRFFNLNYGPKLMAFLDALGDMFKILGPRDQSKDVYNSTGFRGRISRKYVDLEFSKVFPDKIPVYIISWFLLVVNWIITAKDVVVPKFYLHIMKFHPKIHMLIFNILHIDFIFYGCRTLLHARNLHTDSNLAFVILVLVSADFFLLLEAVYSTSSWLRTLTWIRIAEDPVAAARNRHQLAKRSDVEVKLPVEMEDSDKLNHSPADVREDTPLRKDSDGSDPDNKEQKDNQVKPQPKEPEEEQAKEEEEQNNQPKVDYPRTYRKVDWMRQRAVLLSTPLLAEEKVFDNKGCRAHLIIHLMRVSAYQFLPVCGQYASGLLISCLATVEVIKIYHLWTTAGAFPYLKTKVAFFSELIQSMFLMLFLFLLFLMHFKNFGENVLEGPQLFCITLITIAVVVEWALTIAMLFLSLLCPAKKTDKDSKKKTTGIKISEVFIYYKKPETESAVQKDSDSVTKSKAPQSDTTENSEIKQMLDRPIDIIEKVQSQRVQPKSFGQDSETRIKQTNILSTWKGQNRVIAPNPGVPSIIPNNLSGSQTSHSQKEISDRILEYYKRRKLAN